MKYPPYVFDKYGNRFEVLEDTKLHSMLHYKIGTKVKIKNLGKSIDGMIGIITNRDGEYYTVKILSKEWDYRKVHGIYKCELEIIYD